ncbi:transcription antiterminator [Staphylococcus simulans]|uniref:BglG family transcription antiterminator n=1 Tax=Staphylococcus simulans TaxID=1286 RepID=UPI001E42DD0F|nr:BglG family transcription antiterminator [Staphylococcus simulans]MCD8916232.1 transcription antiterminator [Staphylococcus simulans]
MVLSNREKLILEILVKSHGHYITIYEIAQQLAVSSRTIHRELKTLEHDLAELSITIERVPNKGVQLQASKAALHQLQSEISHNAALDLTTEEQKTIILYALIQSKEPIKQYSLAHEICVAQSTLTKLLDELEQEAGGYQLTLERRRGAGVLLTGSEAKKREMLSHLMVDHLNSTSVYSVIENHFVYQSINASQLSMVELDNIFQVERVLMDHLSALPYTLTEASYLTLTVHIVLGIDRIKHGENVTIDESIYQSVKDTQEYDIAVSLTEQLSQIYDVTFNKAEITFITIHLRGAKRKQEDIQADEFQDSDTKINALIQLVEESSYYHFDDKPTLAAGLKLHLIPAINRLNANIETHNPLTQMIRKKYPKLFDSVLDALSIVWPKLYFPDSEVAFVVLHFGGSLRANESKDLDILVVCSSGIGTSRVLATRLEQTFPTINHTKQASLSDLKQLDLKAYDGIISTLALEIDEPYIQVNPLLPEPDAKYVANYLETQTKEDQQRVSETSGPHVLDEDKVIQTLRDNLAVLDNIYIEDAKVTDWQDYLVKLLVKNKCIKDKAAFKIVLNDYARARTITLDPYPIGLPHLKHALILQPMITITRLKQPLAVTEDGKTVNIDYLISMLLPEDSPSSPIVSAISEAISWNLHRIDELMQNPNEIIDEMKKAFIKEARQILLTE